MSDVSSQQGGEASGKALQDAKNLPLIRLILTFFLLRLSHPACALQPVGTQIQSGFLVPSSDPASRKLLPEAHHELSALFSQPVPALSAPQSPKNHHQKQP